MKVLVLLAFSLFAVVAFGSGWEPRVLGKSETAGTPIIALGERLFRDARFSTPKGDLPASCSDCHLYDQDPQGMRAYADFFNRSWVSSRTGDQRRLGLRNAPTILDVAKMPQLHYDGEFSSLEALVKGTISGRPMGWMPGEETEAFNHARSVVLNDKGMTPAGAYRDQFQKVFNVDVTTRGRDEIVNLIAKAVAEYCRTLKTHKDSAYDQFVALNKLDHGPSAIEDAKAFGERFIANVAQLEAKRELRLTKDFDNTALQGLKVFFSAAKGNCVTCHTPPQFTDHSFRNIGISQREYEKFHGEGSFAELSIPDAAAVRRPSPQFREIPSKAKPAIVDLGFWNFVDLKTSRLRREGESDDLFLQRMVGTFKTPTLRNLAYTYPYFHDGSVTSLEGVMAEMMVVSGMAREGRVRAGDEELAKVRFDATDVAALVAFMNSLNEELRR